MERFFDELQQKYDRGELDVALEQCKRAISSFIRGYVAYSALKGWDCEQVVLRFNKQFLNSQYEEEFLKREVKFYVDSLKAIPHIRQRLKL